MLSRELADLARIPPPAPLSIVDFLEKRRLDSRRRDKDDCRDVVIRVTPREQKLTGRVAPGVDMRIAGFRFL